MRDFGKLYLGIVAALSASLGGCSTLDLSQPEMALPAAYSGGAEIRLTSFEGASGFGSSAEGPSLDILRDQIVYGMIRCSRPGPRLDVEIDAAFAEGKGAGRGSDRLLGVVVWRDPASRQVVGRHHIDIEAFFGHDYQTVSVNSPDEHHGASVPRGQLRAGEAFAAQICEKAFG